HGLYRTLDGGLSWRAARGAPAEAFRRVRWAPGRPKALFAATDRAVFVSEDAGVSWSLYGEGLSAEPVQALLATPGGALLAAGGRLYRRAVGDAAWAEVAPLPSGAVVSVLMA